jgi:hypothetical protein
MPVLTLLFTEQRVGGVSGFGIKVRFKLEEEPELGRDAEVGNGQETNLSCFCKR